MCYTYPMKRLLNIVKLLSLLLLLLNTTVYAEEISGIKPLYNKVYRSERVGDSYHFLLLTKNGIFYHLITNKTGKLTAKELKSSNILSILKKKQSWGKAYPKKGKYTIDKGNIYTKLLWNRIEVLSSKKIKYLNKVLYLQ